MGLDWVTAIGLVNFFKRHYPFLVVCGLLLHQINWRNIGLIILILFLCQLVLNLAQHYKALRQFFVMYNELFRKKRPEFKRYVLSDYFGLDQIANSFALFGVNPYLKMFHENIDDAVCIIDSSSLGPETISDLVCVARPMFKSYIFIKHPPNPLMSPIERLKIAHEIGHFILSPLYLSSKRTGGIFLALVFAIIFFQFISISSIPLWLLITYCCVFLFRICDWLMVWLPTSLRDEVYADLFAIYLLTEDEKIAVWNRFSSPGYKVHRFFKNSKIITKFTERRMEIFMRNLQAVIHGNQKEYIGSTIKNMERPIFFQTLTNLFWVSFYLSFGLFLKTDLQFNLGSWLIINILVLLVMIILQFANGYADDFLAPSMALGAM